ncbi:hypothetical protein M23134_07019 [Microscilla marina ATCC 23134]|uniref:Uncharacterized protein n=1 Tax=Microscilla marina ATCC 23134 TaxID=313606 RepID=A1ZT34_MICM2|nr:hypothetical protein M23134_07019 [Microscilla marina ATCC 23134]
MNVPISEDINHQAKKIIVFPKGAHIRQKINSIALTKVIIIPSIFLVKVR